MSQVIRSLISAIYFPSIAVAILAGLGTKACAVGLTIAAPPSTPTAPSPCAASIPGDGLVPYPTDTAPYPLTDGLYERPETSVTMLGPDDGVANSYTKPFPGSLGGRYLLFYNGSHITLAGKGYVLMRWEYAYFNRGGIITPAIAPSVTARPGSFVKRVAGAGRFMPDPDVDGIPGATGLWRPGSRDFTPMSTSGSPMFIPTGWQDEYYYVDGTVTFVNRERGLDYNIALTPVTGVQFRTDIAHTKVGSASNIQRMPLLLDPYRGASRPASPTQLQASVVSDSRVQLRWANCATNAKGYLVEISFSGEFGDSGKTRAYKAGDLYAYAGSYPDGTEAATIATLSPATRYLMRVKAYNDAGDSAYSNTVGFTTDQASPPPHPYIQSDVSATRLAALGTASVSKGNFAVRAATGDISSASDSFTFVHRPMTGDGTFTARIVGLSYTARSAKAGVMMRNGTGPDAAYAMTVYQPAAGVRAQRRADAGGPTVQEGSDAASVGRPCWLRVTRRGNVFTMQSSHDGIIWSKLGTRTIVMGATIAVGLAAASQSKRIATASFDSVGLTP